MTTFSQIGQDLWVEKTLKEKIDGLFLDIGCGFPKKINNTYLLEKKHNWKGISIDIDPSYTEMWAKSNRKNSIFLLQDALTIDYTKLIEGFLKENGKDRIDYLSMDLEPPSLTLEALHKLPLNKYRFSVITFEHDLYRGNLHLLQESRKIFNSHNYKLVVDNINNQEDWWIDKTLPELTY